MGAEGAELELQPAKAEQRRHGVLKYPGGMVAPPDTVLDEVVLGPDVQREGGVAEDAHRDGAFGVVCLDAGQGSHGDDAREESAPKRCVGLRVMRVGGDVATLFGVGDMGEPVAVPG